MGLCLTRRAGEALKIGNDIVVHIMAIEGTTQVRVRIEAPKDIKIDRLDSKGRVESKYPVQSDGHAGCVCRTCGKFPAVYLDQCRECRDKSTRADDMEFLKPV